MFKSFSSIILSVTLTSADRTDCAKVAGSNSARDKHFFDEYECSLCDDHETRLIDVIFI